MSQINSILPLPHFKRPQSHSVAVAQMKLFRKLKKNKDQDNERHNPITDGNLLLRPSASSASQARAQPRAQPIAHPSTYQPPSQPRQHRAPPPQPLTSTSQALPLATQVAQASSSLPIAVHPNSTTCPTCYHFSATLAPQHGNPSAKDPSWAISEYSSLSPTTPASRLHPKSQDIIASSSSGCMHCFILRSALGAVYPNWENEETVITLFLAVGVPVVVRMEFGRYETTTMSREQAMQAYGYDVPIKWEVSVIDPAKEKFEVEIYRPVDPETGGGKGTRFDLAGLVEHVGFGEEIPKYPGAEESLAFVRRQVAQCMREHRCGGEADGTLPLLPDRVLWVQANTPSQIQLLEPRGTARGRYIALSYCWGPVSTTTYLTNAQNLASRKSGIEFYDLPPLLQDVVSVVRALGVEYIWVDRLCIVQGPGGDFAEQAPKMGEIYGSAWLTIAAASGNSEDDRILLERTIQGRGPYSLDLDLQGMGTLSLKIRRRTHRLGTEDSGGDYGRVSTRAWIWQERLLSSRTLFFTPSAIKFECRKHSVWEGYGANTYGHSWSTQIDLESASLNAWVRLVSEFMQRNITHPSDRLPAIDSVMRHIRSRTGWTAFYGVFEEHLIPSLCWSAQEKKGGTGKYACQMNPGHYAPSWSWASVDGPISYLSAMTDGAYAPLRSMDPTTFELQCQAFDRDTGALTLTGRYLIGGVRCLIKPNSLPEDQQDPRMGPHYHTYEVRVSGAHKDFGFNPDVPLMSHGGNPEQPYTPSIVRAPYNAQIPNEEWTGNCLVFLVATRKKKSLALLLGASLGSPNAGWERIGFTTGIEMSVWEEDHVKKGEITVV